MTVSEYINTTVSEYINNAGCYEDWIGDVIGIHVRVHAVCADKSIFTIQDHARAYAKEEERVEVACRREAELEPYDEGGILYRPRDVRCYRHVPIELLDHVVSAHGGITGESTIALVEKALNEAH